MTTVAATLRRELDRVLDGGLPVGGALRKRVIAYARAELATTPRTRLASIAKRLGIDEADLRAWLDADTNPDAFPRPRNWLRWNKEHEAIAQRDGFPWYQLVDIEGRGASLTRVYNTKPRHFIAIQGRLRAVGRTSHAAYNLVVSSGVLPRS